MAIFSKTCEYAMRAVFFVSQKASEGQRVGIKEIAAGIDSPEHFLAKIMQDLVRRGIIESFKGPNGGFFLTEENMNRPLSDVVEAVDGDQLFIGCGLGLKQCSEKNPCPLHNEFKGIRNELTKMLCSTTVKDFNADLISGATLLKK